MINGASAKVRNATNGPEGRRLQQSGRMTKCATMCRKYFDTSESSQSMRHTRLVSEVRDQASDLRLSHYLYSASAVGFR
jgi:hypothetical protein